MVVSSSPSPEKEPLPPAILFRRAKVFSSDPTKIANAAYTTYIDTALQRFLAPGRVEHEATCRRNWRQRVVTRMLNSRNVTIVAYPAGSPNDIVGAISFARLGDNFPSEQEKRDWRPWIVTMFFALLSWMWKWDCKIVNYMRPDLSEDAANVQKFLAWVEVDDERYWDPVTFPERKERWHVQSMAVLPTWQRRGIGTRFLEEVISRARKERTCMGVEASAIGTKAYEKVGCQKLGDFYGDEVEGGGGVFMWRPEGWKGDEKEREELMAK